ncbi:hypothetical protein PX701_09380 [Agromyces sp. H3Y2-19a]|uniref:hypothetical protein n=1 Tax=Agromyces TaxID=33877 RepID=UPI001E43269D|nr:MULTISPECIES: hypothetical protein [Agromyces]MCD5344989.1 hypothetical protein [Agromyces sp. S2-1-8]MDF0513830.1 hypothetical protein [Agromyces chromiiresistens]
MIVQSSRYVPPKPGWAAELLLLGAVGGLLLGAVFGLLHALVLTDAALRQGAGIAAFFAVGGACAGVFIGAAVAGLGALVRLVVGLFVRAEWIEAASVGLGTAMGALSVYYLIPWGYPMSLGLYVPLFVIAPAALCSMNTLWARRIPALRG